MNGLEDLRNAVALAISANETLIEMSMSNRKEYKAAGYYFRVRKLSENLAFLHEWREELAEALTEIQKCNTIRLYN